MAGSIVFLHQVIAGAADRSYGVHVARLAGPAGVLHRAERILDELEAGQHGAVDAKVMADRLPLFDCHQQAQDSRIADDKIAEVLDTVEPDSLAPREALDVIYRLKTSSFNKLLFSRKK